MHNLRRWVADHAVAVYFLIALAISWAIAIPLALAAQGDMAPPWPFGLHYLASLGPITAAVVVTCASSGASGLADLLACISRWRIGWRWWLIAAGSPVGLFVLALIVARVVEGSWPDVRRVGEVNFLGDIGVVAALLLWIASFGFGEETGWRGFALARLQRRHSPASATVLVALVWAVWHVPYWFYLPGYQDLGIAGAPGFFIGLLLGAILMTWLYNGTGGSVAAVAVWHALFDFFSGSHATDGLMNGVMSTVVALWAVGIALVAYRRRRATRHRVGGGRAGLVNAICETQGALPVRYGLRLVTATSLVTAVMLACTAVAGLLFGARGLYRPDPATLPAFLGQDAVTLLAILPLLLWSVRAARRGSLRGLLLWAAALFYVAYSYAYYALSPEFNWLYLAYIAIVAMSLYGCLYLLLAIDANAVAERFDRGTPVHAAGGFLMALPVALGFAWVAMILAHLASGQMPKRVDQVVWPVDLIVAFPAMFWAGLWLWRRQPLGYVTAAVLLIKGGLLGVTLVVNTWITMTFWGGAMDPAAPVYALGGLGGLTLAARYLQHLRPEFPGAASSAPAPSVTAGAQARWFDRAATELGR